MPSEWNNRSQKPSHVLVTEYVKFRPKCTEPAELPCSNHPLRPCCGRCFVFLLWVLLLNLPLDLTGKLLIAMPGMGDPRFDHSVVYLCAHSEDGAMGLIVNKRAADVTMFDLMEQLDIESETGKSFLDTSICCGGPVEQGRGFVLHSPEYHSQIQTLEVDAAFSMTSTMDVLEDIAKGNGPEKSLLMLGYSGWGAGQLENEIAMNGWLTAPATLDLVFDVRASDKWAAALKSIGVDPIGLSAAAGRA